MDELKLVTQTEFANKCGITPQEVRTYINRGKLDLTGKKINLSTPKNAEFLAKHLEMKGIEAELLPEDGEGEMPQAMYALDKQIKSLTIVKLKKENTLKQVQIDRFSGVLVPTDLIKMVFIQYSKSMVTSMQQALENSLIEIAAAANLSSKQVADYRAKNIKILNQASKTASESFLRGLDNIVDEYSQARMRGEKKN